MPRPHKRRSYRSRNTSADNDASSSAEEPAGAEPEAPPTDGRDDQPSDGIGDHHADDATAPADEGVAPDVPAEANGGPTRSYGPMESMVRRPLLALLPVLVLVTIAGLLGVLRAPVYTAEARLLVGSLVRDFTPADGLVAANQELTTIYSRVVGSPAHLDRAARELGEDIPPDSVDAYPVPESPFIRVEATGSTQEEAIRRADAAAAALAAYGADLRDQAVARDEALLGELNAKSEALAAARLERDAQQDTYNTLSNTSGASPSALEAARVDLVEAEAAAATAQLEFDALRAQLNASDVATRGGIELNEFADAEPKGSDRRSTFVLYVAVALVVGGLMGAALATLSANHWRLLPTEVADGDRAERPSTFIWSNTKKAFVPVQVDDTDTDTDTDADADADADVTSART